MHQYVGMLETRLTEKTYAYNVLPLIATVNHVQRSILLTKLSFRTA